jgi:molybdopterin-guanine dinucleotide biosynthesis protein A
MSFDLAILAGGASSRMGRPKTDLEINGKPILRWLLERLKDQRRAMLITSPGHEHPAGCDAFDGEFVDPIAGQGPLRGVITALENCGDAKAVLILTCDMPLVTAGILASLEASLHGQPKVLGVMSQHGEQIEPFPLVASVALLPILHERLHAGRRSLRALASDPSIRVVMAPREWGDAVWTNLNSPTDFDRFIAEHQA